MKKKIEEQKVVQQPEQSKQKAPKDKKQKSESAVNLANDPNYAYNNNPSQYAVELLGITKTFNDGALKANDDLTLRVKKGEIHALVGENGAGKTTIMSILFGFLKPDHGLVYVNGKQTNFKSPNEASAAGIGMVHQHFKLVNAFTVHQNIILGAEKTNMGFINYKISREKIQKLMKRYDLQVDLDNKVISVSVGQQQRTEILKLLYRDANILIFDEPTAVLSDKEIAGFLEMLLEFKKQGKTIILITHKLDEVKKVADRATIIRHGQSIETVDVKTTSTQDIANMMVGHKLVINVNDAKAVGEDKPVVVSIKDLCANKVSQPRVRALNNLNLDIRQGEILGIAGVEGNGQTELALILGGLLKNKVTGNVKIYNPKTKIETDVLTSNVNKLYTAAGVAHIPEDRLKYGLVLDETVAMNTVLPEIGNAPFSRGGFINQNAIDRYAQEIIRDWDVRGANRGKALARALSGGNQQKLVVGRELTRKHTFAIFVQPTRGLDMGAIQFIHKKIMEDAQSGATVLLISYELDEILAISSRIAVMNHGKIVFDAPARQVTRSLIGKYISRGATAKGGE